MYHIFCIKKQCTFIKLSLLWTEYTGFESNLDSKEKDLMGILTAMIFSLIQYLWSLGIAGLRIKQKL